MNRDKNNDMKKNDNKQLLDLDKLKIANPFEGEGTLKQRVSASAVFVIYCTKGFYECLARGDEEVSEPIRLAKELEKPVILLLDTKLSKFQIADMRTIKGINIIKEIIYDFNDNVKKIEVEKEIIIICGKINDSNYFAFRWN